MKKTILLFLLFCSFCSYSQYGSKILENFGGFTFNASVYKNGSFSPSPNTYYGVSPSDFTADTWASGNSYVWDIISMNAIVLGATNYGGFNGSYYVFSNHSYTTKMKFAPWSRSMYVPAHFVV